MNMTVNLLTDLPSRILDETYTDNLGRARRLITSELTGPAPDVPGSSDDPEDVNTDLTQ